VRDAVIAIAALAQGGKVEEKLMDATTNNAAIPFTRSQYVLYARQQFGRAIMGMRHAISNDQFQLRSALIACLLVICFEVLGGDHFTALTHALSGVKLMQSWLAQNPYKKPETEGLVSPASNIIEDDLVQAFARLDLQVLSYVAPRPIEVHQRLSNEGTDAIKNMPSLFSDVEQARLYWELVQRRTSHYLATVVAIQTELDGKAPSPKGVDVGKCGDVVNVSSESDLYVSASVDLQHVNLKIDYTRCCDEIMQWFEAFTPFFLHTAISQQSDPETWSAAGLVQLQAVTTKIMLLSSVSSEECYLDRFLPQYRSIVSLARRISENEIFQAKSYTFDLGIVYPLFVVSKWCRHPEVRREAIELLRKTDRREGIWDGPIMASTSEWIMEIEEEGMEDGGLIPEAKRAKITKIKPDMQNRRAELEGTLCGRGEDGSKDVRMKTIGW